MTKQIYIKTGVFCGLSDQYPNLHIGAEVSGEVTLRGKFPIVHEGREVDRFFLKMEVPKDFPGAWPRVWETQGRIPCTLDRHVNQKDGTLCVMLPDEAYMRCVPILTIVDYLNDPLRNFFIGQLCIENDQPWPWGEHRHGLNGVVDYYSDLLALTDPVAVVKVLLLVDKGHYKGHWPCPCGRGEIIRKCHGAIMRAVGERVPKTQLKSTLEAIALHLERERHC